MKPSQLRKIDFRGFLLRDFDNGIYEAVNKSTVYNLLSEQKTHSPILIVKTFKDYTKAMVLEATHRICSVLQRKRDKDAENFEFKTYVYEIGDDFDTGFDNSAPLVPNSSQKTDITRFPPNLLSLIHQTFGREFNKSLAQFSRFQQAVVLKSILSRYVSDEQKEQVLLELHNNNATPILDLYKKCFHEGIVAAEFSNDHTEKSPYFSFFMPPKTGDVFLQQMDVLPTANKTHFLILKACLISDSMTADLISSYVGQNIDANQLRTKLNEIIHNDDDDLEFEGTDKTAETTRKPTGRKGAPKDGFKVVEATSVSVIPENSVVQCIEKVKLEHIDKLKEKSCSIIVVNPFTDSNWFQMVLTKFTGGIRFGVLGGSAAVAIGPHIKPGAEIRAANIKMLLIKMMSKEETTGRKLDVTLFQLA
ncbi:hypothetical protein CAEBREN_09535 [Caenorhabditis brenneri]|uniref:Uncharacterized protein n=1 Tax=Caenorhabditis brenneri TaxID=135651 RepID=G0P1H4_CAEBE|nr:hypothetical protein CAEBREN_09535 [Caenorhabditis brenneri]